MWIASGWLTLLGLCWALTIARCRSLRSTAEDRALNIYRVCQTTACTVLSPVAEHLLPRALAVQLGMFCVVAGILFAATTIHLYQLPRTRRVHPPSRRLIATTLAALVILGCPAWWRGHTPFDDVNPAMLGYWLLYVIPVWTYLPILINGALTEIRARISGNEALALTLVALSTGASLPMTGLLLANAVVLTVGHRSGLTASLILAYPYYLLFMTVSHSVLFGLPTLNGMARRFALDRCSRQRRRLAPLWSDLTAACPEIVHLAPPIPDTVDSRYRLHRTIVEIRDSMLILARYTTPLPSEIANPRHDQTLTHAIRLARAAAAKTRGDTPRYNAAMQHSAAHDLLAETHELARIAHLWPRAKTLVSQDH